MTPSAAFSISAMAHHGQHDKAGRPYVLHPRRVADTLGDECAVVALLHDVLEDHGTEWPLWRLKDLGLTDAQADSLVAITRQPHESYTAYIERCVENPVALEVKIADLRDNLDPERLQHVEPDTRRRLVGKYAPALATCLDALYRSVVDNAVAAYR